MDVFSRIHVARSGQNFPSSVIKRTPITRQSTAFFGVSQRGTQKFVSNRGANSQQRIVHGGGDISVPEAGGPCQAGLWLLSLGEQFHWCTRNFCGSLSWDEGHLTPCSGEKIQFHDV